MPVILPPVPPAIPAIIRPAAHSPRPAAPHPRPNDQLEPPLIVRPVQPVLPPAAPATKSPTVERPAVTGRDGESQSAPSNPPKRP